jgi:hypothetical protein
MKRNLSVVLALSALILTCGCKKSINSSSVDLSKGTKAVFASNPSWQTPTKYGRIIRFDQGDGNGSDCLLAWDIQSNTVSMTQVNGTNSTNLFTTSGFQLTNHATVNVNTYFGDVTDYYNQNGGVNIIALDANHTGREDCILIYIPGRGMWWLLNYQGGYFWNLLGSGTGGIGGYDLAGATLTDKIIAYDYGDGYTDHLICYRPGNGYFWVLQNTNAGTTLPGQNQPNWVAVVKSGGGVGGYDLKGPTDQIVAVPTAGSPGYMQLVCYRPGPGLGYVYWETHSPNSTSWTTVAPSHSGLNGNSFQGQGDRMIAVNLSTSGATGYNSDTYTMGYRPGFGSNYTYNYQWVPSLNIVETWNLFSGLNYPFTNLPYNPFTYVGDHVLAFSPNGQGNTSLLCFSNGAGQSQLYEWGPGSYNQVY